jgi:hypothetical protein
MTLETGGPVDLHLRSALEAFFDRRTWPSSMDRWEHSGLALAEKVMRRSPRFTLDVGCGHNEFKGHIRNLIGIDLVNDAADLVCDFVEAPVLPGSIDAILALGSVNFGDRDTVEHQLTVLAQWLSGDGRIYMRGNPGVPVDDEIPIFAWSEEEVLTLGAKCGLKLDGPVLYEHIEGPWGKPLTRLVWTYMPVSS